MAELVDTVPLNPPDILESDSTSINAILDSRDPYEHLNNLSSARNNSDINDLSFKTDSGCAESDSCRNGDVGLLEIAVEAQPDLIFESDLVSITQDQLSFVRPRVYLERESFSNQNEDSMSRTANVRFTENISPLDLLNTLNKSGFVNLGRELFTYW